MSDEYVDGDGYILADGDWVHLEGSNDCYQVGLPESGLIFLRAEETGWRESIEPGLRVMRLLDSYRGFRWRKRRERQERAAILAAIQ